MRALPGGGRDGKLTIVESPSRLSTIRIAGRVVHRARPRQFWLALQTCLTCLGPDFVVQCRYVRSMPAEDHVVRAKSVTHTKPEAQLLSGPHRLTRRQKPGLPRRLLVPRRRTTTSRPSPAPDSSGSHGRRLPLTRRRTTASRPSQSASVQAAGDPLPPRSCLPRHAQACSMMRPNAIALAIMHAAACGQCVCCNAGVK